MKKRKGNFIDDNIQWTPLGGFLMHMSGAILLGVGAICVALMPSMFSHMKDMTTFHNKLSEDLGYDVVDVTAFNAYQQDEHYYVSIMGKGKKQVETGETCEYIKCEYETDEVRFNSLIESIKNESVLNEDVAYSVKVVENLADIVVNGKLTHKNERMDITFAHEGEENTQILDVSQPKIEGNIAYYYVVSLQEGVNHKGKVGLYTYVDKVSFTLTKEIEKDPSIIFTMGKENAYVETIGRNFDLTQEYTYTMDSLDSSTYSIEQENTNSNSR